MDQKTQNIESPAVIARSDNGRVTNPHEFEVDGVAFMGTSGQNVADVLRYSEGDDACDALARILEWGHLVPTAPDTLAAYPFADDDPFVLRAAPHVFFAGNQPAFATRLVTGMSRRDA